VSRQDGSVRTFTILRELLDGTKPADIARKYDVSRQWINIIKRKGIESGFELQSNANMQKKR